MSLIFPETDFVVSKNKEYNLSNLKLKLIGKNSFQVNSVLGNSNVFYDGEFDYNQILFTRNAGISFRLAPYPTAKITVKEQDDKSEVRIKISLSIFWKMAVLFGYILITVSILFNIFYKDVNNPIFIILKGLLAFSVMNLFIRGYHSSEKKNIQLILKNILDSEDIQKSV